MVNVTIKYSDATTQRGDYLSCKVREGFIHLVKVVEEDSITKHKNIFIPAHRVMDVTALSDMPDKDFNK